MIKKRLGQTNLEVTQLGTRWTRGIWSTCFRDSLDRSIGNLRYPELQGLDERERFRKMWGERMPGMYPMWLLVPGGVAEVQSKDDLAILTINVDAERVNPTFRLETRTV